MSTLLILGARSFVADSLIEHLQQQARPFIGVSRQIGRDGPSVLPGADGVRAEHCISLLPLPALLPLLDWLQRCGCRRLVALSSTSRYTKPNSSCAQERQVAQELADAEDRLTRWAQQAQISCTILRPTLIYGHGRDRNLSTLLRFARRTHLVLLPLGAGGRRQPIHADDVALACLAALDADLQGQQAFDLPGGETLSYSAMVERLLSLLDTPVWRLHLPVACLRLGIRLLAHLPRYRHLTTAMAERMVEDLVFSAAPAEAAFGYRARPFAPRQQDLPCD